MQVLRRENPAGCEVPQRVDQVALIGPIVNVLLRCRRATERAARLDSRWLRTTLRFSAVGTTQTNEVEENMGNSMTDKCLEMNRLVPAG